MKLLFSPEGWQVHVLFFNFRSGQTLCPAGRRMFRVLKNPRTRKPPRFLWFESDWAKPSWKYDHSRHCMVPWTNSFSHSSRLRCKREGHVDEEGGGGSGGGSREHNPTLTLLMRRRPSVSGKLLLYAALEQQEQEMELPGRCGNYDFINFTAWNNDTHRWGYIQTLIWHLNFTAFIIYVFAQQAIEKNHMKTLMMWACVFLVGLVWVRLDVGARSILPEASRSAASTALSWQQAGSLLSQPRNRFPSLNSFRWR